MEGDFQLLLNGCQGLEDFNPLPPCGGRRQVLGDTDDEKDISIHSLRVEGDWRKQGNRSVFSNFNPLPPCGGRPRILKRKSRRQTFQSTPSVWRETATRKSGTSMLINFNPLPPCGGRPDTTQEMPRQPNQRCHVFVDISPFRAMNKTIFPQIFHT